MATFAVGDIHGQIAPLVELLAAITPDVDDRDWPRPRIVRRTYGLDTIAHGVLTGIRLPGPRFYQSGRHARRHQQ